MTGLLMAAGPAAAQQSELSGEVRVWSWNVAADALEALVPEFNKLHPNVRVVVEDTGTGPTFDRGLAGCAAGGSGMPDVYTVRNREAEVFWARFPDCFRDIAAMSAEEPALLERFPAYKLIEFKVGEKTYAMPWDSGPAAVFYRRDMYEKAGVDAASVETWDDFIEAGRRVSQANGGNLGFVSIDSGWFRILANQNGCAYFDDAGENVTINQPGCVSALQTIGRVKEAGLLSTGTWGESLQAINGNRVMGAINGGWYEGSIRSAAPDQSGNWGVHLLPALEPGGNRAANNGGSGLAIPSASRNPEAALAFVNFALGTPEGQILQLKSNGLIPTLPEAVNDPFVREPQPYWGGQPIWETLIGTLPDIAPARHTQYFAEADSLFLDAYNAFLNDGGDAKQVLDRVADEISGATGLPTMD